MMIIDMAVLAVVTVLLTILMLATRKYDTAGWWLYRLLLTFAMIEFIYLSYDAYMLGADTPIRYVLIRYGFVAMAIAMLLMWHLLTRQKQRKRKQQFSDRITAIFNASNTGQKHP